MCKFPCLLKSISAIEIKLYHSHNIVSIENIETFQLSIPDWYVQNILIEVY